MNAETLESIEQSQWSQTGSEAYIEKSIRMREDLVANIKVQISKEHKILLVRYERISKDLEDKLLIEN